MDLAWLLQNLYVFSWGVTILAAGIFIYLIRKGVTPTLYLFAAIVVLGALFSTSITPFPSISPPFN